MHFGAVGQRGQVATNRATTAHLFVPDIVTKHCMVVGKIALFAILLMVEQRAKRKDLAMSFLALVMMSC